MIFFLGRSKYILMVSVAKRLRRQVVALEIEGSNPFTHPTLYGTAGRQRGRIFSACVTRNLHDQMRCYVHGKGDRNANDIAKTVKGLFLPTLGGTL